jgi:hypothetical protein
MNNYYVYIYFNKYKKGEFIYDDLIFEYEPFYVGKGKNSRYLRHLKMFESNKPKNFVIKEHLDNNDKPIIIKYKENLSNKESLNIEVDLIKRIGRKDLSNGPLLNLTNGGEKSIGYKHTEEYKEKLKKPVIKHDLNGNILKEYGSISEAALDNNTSYQNIGNICSGKQKIFDNKFIFLYKNDIFNKRERNKKEYPIIMVDYNGVETHFKSITECSNITNININGIARTCKGQSVTSHGFLFKFLNNNYSEKIEEKISIYKEYFDKKIIYKNKEYKNILHAVNETGVSIYNIYCYIQKTMLIK